MLKQIFKIFFLLTVFLMPSKFVLAATITSTQSGNWNDSATWVGGIVPGNGDSAIVAAAHTVTITADQTIGTSGAAGTAALTCNGNCVVVSGATLTARGDIIIADTKTLTFNAGSHYLADSSLATGTPSYKISTSTTAALVTNGSASSRVTMGKAAGSGNWYISYGGSNPRGRLNLNYTDFSDMSGSGNGASIDMGVNGGLTSSYVIDHCTFTRIAKIFLWQIAATSDVRFTNNVFSGNGSYTQNLKIQDAAIPTTGARILTGNVFDRPVLITATGVGAAGWTIENNYFTSLYADGAAAFGADNGSTQTTADIASFKNNFVYSTFDNGALQVYGTGTAQNNFIYADHNNPHHVVTMGTSNGGTLNLEGNIFQSGGSNDDGDCVIPTQPASWAYTLNLKNNIVLPEVASGGSSGTLYTYLRNDTSPNHITLNASNNTVNTGVQAATMQEGNLTHSNLGYYRNNLDWGTSSKKGYHVRSSNGLAIYGGASVYASSLSSDNVTLNKSTATWPVNFFTSSNGTYKLVILSGTNAGQVRTIVSNTATQLTVDSAFSSPCDTTSAFEIVNVDVVASDYNGGFNLLSGNVYDGNGQNPVSAYGYLNMAFSTPPGAHDIVADPQFVDSTRNLQTWGQVRQGTDGSVAAALSAIKNNPGLINDLVSWVSAGFAPTNIAYHASGYGGADIGAVAVVLPSSYNINDFVTLISNWLHAGPNSDINFDSRVNAKDLGIMMSKWD